MAEKQVVGRENRTSLAERLAEHAPPGLDSASVAWARTFAEHGRRARRIRRVLRALPGDPRCKICHAPFTGAAGRMLRLTGFRASRKSPELCHVCVEEGPAGGFEAEIGILFGDVRGFTSFAESHTPSETAQTLQRFYDVASRTIIKHEGIVDKLVGDQVMALFWPVVMDAPACPAMVDAAHDLLREVGHGSAEGAWLPLGIGLDYGTAYVGNVGGEGLRDFTALGDVVNTASRLQGEAGAGEVVMGDRVYGAVAQRFPEVERVEVALKGKSLPTTAYRLAIAQLATRRTR